MPEIPNVGLGAGNPDRSAVQAIDALDRVALEPASAVSVRPLIAGDLPRLWISTINVML